MYDFQKANMWKRISAALFDFILICIVVVGFAFLLSTVLGFDGYNQQFEELHTSYKKQYGIVTQEDYNNLSAEERANYFIEEDYAILNEEKRANYDAANDAAYDALTKDSEANYLYSMIMNLTFIIVIFSILLGYVLLEFVIPLIFKNGQTVGKKIFGIAVMREDGVKISPIVLFVRTVLGKYTVETMLPILLIASIFLGLMGIVGIIVIAVMLIAQIVLLIVTKARTPLHDVLAHTVAVDAASQMIFDSTDDMIAYKKRIHAENVEAEKN